MDGIILYADGDITKAIEKAVSQSGDFYISKKVESYSDCLSIVPQAGVNIMILQVNDHIYKVQNLLHDLNLMDRNPLFILFEVRETGKICYTTTNQNIYPQVKSAARLFENALEGMYKCGFSYFRTAAWNEDALQYTDAASRCSAVIEILRGCTAEECLIYRKRFNLDLKENGYYLYFCEIQYSEYRDHMINKDVYNYIGEILKRECMDVISAYNGGEIIDITLDFLCVIINDLNVRSEAGKRVQFEEMLQKLLRATGCKTANRYLSSRFKNMKDLRQGYDQYRSERADVFFQRDAGIMRAALAMHRKQPADMEQVYRLLQEITNILCYDLSNPVLKDILYQLYFEILKPSFNFTLFYYCTAVICSGISRVQDSLDDSLIRENLNPYLLQFSSIEEQYDNMLRRIHALQVKYVAKRQTKNTLALKAMNYIADNYAREITISDIADALYISKVYLSQIFKSQLGVSVIQYLIAIRIEESRKLLKDTDDMIYVIAEKVGFHDSRHFSKTFKKVMGISPGEYRKKRKFVITPSGF